MYGNILKQKIISPTVINELITLIAENFIGLLSNLSLAKGTAAIASRRRISAK